MKADFFEKIRFLLSQVETSESVDCIFQQIDNSNLNDLICAVEDEDPELVLRSIQNLMSTNVTRDEQFERLGHLARVFQNSLTVFRDGLGARLNFDSIDSHNGSIETEINSIIQESSKSSMKVLEIANVYSSSIDSLRNSIVSFSSTLGDDNHTSPLSESFSGIETEANMLQAQLNQVSQELLFSQSYQDLTGQILLRLKTFMTSVEGGVLEIVRMLAESNIDNDLSEIDRLKFANSCNQDDVDDLLSSLGF